MRESRDFRAFLRFLGSQTSQADGPNLLRADDVGEVAQRTASTAALPQAASMAASERDDNQPPNTRPAHYFAHRLL